MRDKRVHARASPFTIVHRRVNGSGCFHIAVHYHTKRVLASVRAGGIDGSFCRATSCILRACITPRAITYVPRSAVGPKSPGSIDHFNAVATTARKSWRSTHAAIGSIRNPQRAPDPKRSFLLVYHAARFPRRDSREISLGIKLERRGHLRSYHPARAETSDFAGPPQSSARRCSRCNSRQIVHRVLRRVKLKHLRNCIM